MDSSEPTKAPSTSARRQTHHCVDCGAPLTMHEHYPLCDRCELDYQHDTHSDDDYPRAA